MKYTLPSADIKKLSLGFFFLFFGYNSVQQYPANYFNQSGLPDLVFKVLITVYLFFTLADPLSAIVVSRFGPKLSMVLGTVFYSLFILAAATKLSAFIYPAAILLGVAAALLWTGQNSYLIRSSESKDYGKNIGFFGTFMALGTVLGIPLFGLLVSRFSFELPIIFFAVFPLIGLICLSQLKDVASEPVRDHLGMLQKTLSSKMALRFSFIWFASYFSFGLVIGLIPVNISESLGLNFVGPLTAIFYLLPVFLSYFLGSLSDKKGRFKIMSLLLLVGALGLLLLYFAASPLLYFIGISLLALSSIAPVAGALVGDVTSAKNLTFLTAILWMAQNIGVVSSLVLSSFVRTRNTYLFSMVVLAAAALAVYSLGKKGLGVIKETLDREIADE